MKTRNDIDRLAGRLMGSIQVVCEDYKKRQEDDMRPLEGDRKKWRSAWNETSQKKKGETAQRNNRKEPTL